MKEPPLRVIPGGPGAGHFLERDGRPVFLIGDSITQGWAESGTDLDQEAWVSALAARGIRALHLWGFIAPQSGDDERLGYDAPEILPWVRTGPRRWDLGRHDEAYFERLRDLCERARDAAVLVVIQVFDGWTKTRFASHPFNAACGGPLQERSAFVALADPDRELAEAPDPGWGWRELNQHYQERYAARLIRATADLPNVLYEIFNEGEWYPGDLRRSHEGHFLAFFRARCRSLLISNDDHIRGADPKLGPGGGFRRDPRNDIISHHRPNWSLTTRAAESFEHYLAEFRGRPAKPFLFTEPVPEFRGEDPREVEALTRLLWGTALGGAGFFVQNDASFGFNPKARIAARAELRDRMLDREGACSRFFNDLPVGWPAMEPAPEISSTGLAMARPGAEYVVYSEEGPSFTVDLSAAEGIDLESRSYDPRTGTLSEAVAIRGGSSAARIVKPDGRDWVYWIRRPEKLPSRPRTGTGRGSRALCFNRN